MPAPAQSWMFSRRLAASGVAVVLLAGGYLGSALNPYNRFYMLFAPVDTAALALDLITVALLAAAGLHGLARVTAGRSDRWLAPWFYFLAVLAAFNFRPMLRLALVPHAPWLSGPVYYLLIWTLGGLLTAAGYAWRRMGNGASVGWRYSVYLWPLLPILAVNLLLAPRWPVEGPVPSELGPRPEGAGPSVVVVILDMVGYEDAFTPAGQIRSELPQLAAFARAATVFHRARSPGDETGRSLPGLLLQEEVGIIELAHQEARWKPAAAPEAPARRAEEFGRALPYAFARAGFRRVLIGYYLPYAALMPGAFDAVLTGSYYGAALGADAGRGLATACLHQWVRFAEESKDPLSAAAKQLGVTAELFGRYYRNLNGAVHAEGLRYFREGLSPGDFAVLHLPVPHQPYVFAADGGPSGWAGLDPAGYPGQLAYADRLFGEWMQALRDSGRWDESWVIMLSDHGPHFRDYAGTPDGKRHVPFLVKAPGQTDRRDVREPIRLADFETIPGFPWPDAAAEETR